VRQQAHGLCRWVEPIQGDNVDDEAGWEGRQAANADRQLLGASGDLGELYGHTQGVSASG